MSGFSRWVFSFFLSTAGIAVLGALDSSILFSLPFAIDAAVIVLAAQHQDLFWLYPLIVVPASLLGAATTYWVGAKIDEEGLQRFVPKQRLDRIHARVRRSGAFALAALDLIPPPFPFTPFILAAGALDVPPGKFFLTLAAVRLIRFGSEALLALFYGDVIVTWLKSDAVRTVAGALFVLVLVGAGISSYRLIRSTRRQKPARSVRAGSRLRSSSAAGTHTKP